MDSGGDRTRRRKNEEGGEGVGDIIVQKREQLAASVLTIGFTN